jgi:hypothetical protein
LRILWAIPTSPHSIFTFSKPLRWNLRKPILHMPLVHRILQHTREHLLDHPLHPAPPEGIDRPKIRSVPATDPHEVDILSQSLRDPPRRINPLCISVRWYRPGRYSLRSRQREQQTRLHAEVPLRSATAGEHPRISRRPCAPCRLRSCCREMAVATPLEEGAPPPWLHNYASVMACSGPLRRSRRRPSRSTATPGSRR